jgi:hypothetical protein
VVDAQLPPHPPTAVPPESKSPRPVYPPNPNVISSGLGTSNDASNASVVPTINTGSNTASTTTSVTAAAAAAAGGGGRAVQIDSVYTVPPACYRLLHDWLETGKNTNM